MEYSNFIGNLGLAIAIVSLGILAWDRARPLPTLFWLIVGVACLAYGTLMMVVLALEAVSVIIPSAWAKLGQFQ